MTKLLSAVAAGNPPDMVTIYSAINIPSLVEQGAVLSLNDYAGPNDLDEAKKWFVPAVLDLGTYKGKIWGLSYWMQTSCIAWNKNHFKQANLDPESPPKTVADLDEMAAKLTKMDGGQITRMGALPTYFWMWVTDWGGSLFDESAQKVTANDPKVLAAFSWMASYSKRYEVTKVQAFQQGLASERAGVLDPFLAEKFSIIEVGGPWKLGDWKTNAPKGFEYGIAPAPTPPPPGVGGLNTYSYGDYSVVPKGTKHPAEAWQFVKYTGGLGGTLEDYFTVLTWGNQPINVPVTTQILDFPALKKVIADFPGFQEMIGMFFKGRVGFPPKMPVGTFYADRLGAAADKIRLLQKTPEQALDEVTQEVQKELDKFFSQQKK